MHVLKTVRGWHSLGAILFVVLFLGSCADHLDPRPGTQTYLVSSTKVAEIPLAQLTALVTQTYPTYAPLLKYGISAYRLVYKTKNWDGTPINASGLLLIPATSNPVPMISQQHGTVFDDAQSPSNFGPNSEAYLFGTIYSSDGFIIACPDYIGFGESKDLIHPYEHRASIAQASLDMLRASREYINANAAIKWDSRLYLAGYSEGGYATMALYKKMQDEVPTEFNLRAVSAGAGAHHKTAFMYALLTQPSSANVEWNRGYLWVLLTYNQIYGTLRRPLEYYFKEPYLTDIKANHELATLNVSFDQVLTNTFKTSILNGTDTAFLSALADNDVYNWKPLTPLLLVHGTADQRVYFLNSLNARNAMVAQGSTVVTLLPLPGKTHFETIADWLSNTFVFFQTVK